MKTRRASIVDSSNENDNKENIYHHQQNKQGQHQQKQQFYDAKSISNRRVDDGNTLIAPPIKLLFRRESENSYNVLRVNDDERRNRGRIPRVLAPKNSSPFKPNNSPKKSLSLQPESASRPIDLVVEKKRGRKPNKTIQHAEPHQVKTGISMPTNLNVINRPFRVLVERKPLRIALVEANTDVIQTEALLLLHLFKTRSAPCVYCAECRMHMSVREFGAHFHVELSDTEARRRAVETLKKKSFKTLPCPDQGCTHLSPLQLDRWREFLRIVAEFKIFASPAKLDTSIDLSEESENEEEDDSSSSPGKNGPQKENCRSSPMYRSWDKVAITRSLIQNGISQNLIRWVKIDLNLCGKRSHQMTC